MVARLLVFTLALSATLSLSGCIDEESDDLAKAQDCLDKIDSSNYTSAESCMSGIEKYDTQQANIIKCSIKLLTGGLTTERMVKAYTTLKDAAYTNKEAALISSLTLVSDLAVPPGKTAKTKAEEAKVYCDKTGLNGFVYISNLVYVGSSVAVAAGVDPTNPNTFPNQGDVTTILGECTDFTSGTCDHAAVGAAVEAIGATYCSAGNANSEVCTKINDAVAAAGGNATLVSKQLFCLLETPAKVYTTGVACAPAAECCL